MKNPKPMNKGASLCVALVLLLPITIEAQMAPTPFHEQPVSIELGAAAFPEAAEAVFGAAEDAGEAAAPRVGSVRRLVAAQPGAPWVQLSFGDSRLSEGSYLTITSVEDGQVQQLDDAALAIWGGSSALFNGSAVEVELHLAEGDPGSRVTRMKILEFNVPPSREDGSLRVAAVEDQYPIDTASIEHGVGVGNDWAVFRALPNSQTGLLPAQRQGVFYRLASGITPGAVTVSGYGADDDPPSDSPVNSFRNAQNQTLQTDSGPWVGRTVAPGGNRVTLRYRADTRGGNSGSPVLDPASGLAIGIHTHAGCDGPPEGNRGTGFENTRLRQAIAAATGVEVAIFVDPEHPADEEDGSILRPFDSLGEALAAAPEGAVVHIAPGTYPETSLAVPESVTLSAPAGPFSIGGR